MFSFQNGTGGASDEAGGHYNEAFMCKGVFSEVRLQDESVSNESGGKILPQTKTPIRESSSQKTPNPNEICVSHDVTGVLLHHAHSQNDYTLAISAKQVAEVGLLCMLNAVSWYYELSVLFQSNIAYCMACHTSS